MTQNLPSRQFSSINRLGFLAAVAGVSIALLLLVGFALMLGFRMTALQLPAVSKLAKTTPAMAALAAEIKREHFHSTYGFRRLQHVKTLSMLTLVNGFAEDALPLLQYLAAQHEDQGKWYYFLAQHALSQGDYEAAEQYLHQCLFENPTAAQAELKLAELLFKTNRPELAIQHYTARLDLLPGDVWAGLGKIRCLHLAGNGETALQQLRQWYRQHPTFAPAISLLAQWERQAGHAQEADSLDAICTSLPRHPDAPDAWEEEKMQYCFDPYQLSVRASYLEQIGQVDASIPLLERAIRLSPGDASLHLLLGNHLSLLGKQEPAITHLLTAIQLAPETHAALYDLCRIYLSSGRAAQAIPLLRDAIILTPTSASLHNQLAVCLEFSGQKDAAIESYYRAIQLDPNDFHSNFNLTKALHRKGCLQEGNQYLKRLLVLFPGHYDLLHYAVIHYLESGQLVQAATCLESLKNLPLPSQDAGLLPALQALWHAKTAVKLATDKQWPEAILHLEASIRLDPSLSENRLSLGMLYCKNHQPAEAVQELERYLPSNPDSAEARKWLAMAYLQLNRKDEARSALHQAKANCDPRTDATLLREIQRLQQSMQ